MSAAFRARTRFLADPADEIEMSHPFIVWCRHRTGSSVLFTLLATVSEHQAANGEPFDPHCGEIRQFSHIPSHPECSALLEEICAQRLIIRHIPDRLPLEFNVKLARISSRADYHHIHLDRDPLARLASLGISEQLNAWIAEDRTRKLLAEHAPLKPLNVNRLIDWHHSGTQQWRSIRDTLSTCHEIRYEQLFSGFFFHRLDAFTKLTRYLNIPITKVQKHRKKIDQLLLRGGQETRSAWHRAPNLTALRQALL